MDDKIMVDNFFLLMRFTEHIAWRIIKNDIKNRSVKAVPDYENGDS